MEWIKSLNDLEAARKIGRGVVRGSGDDAVFHATPCGRLDAMVAGGGAEPLRLYRNLAEARKAEPAVGPCDECDPARAEIRDALNRSGAFLHEGVVRDLDRMGYRTRSEVPVSAAPFLSDPSRQPRATSLRTPLGHASMRFLDRTVFQSAVAASQDGSQRRERTVDIYASREKGNTIYAAIIEVKRLDPDYVSWVFLARDEASRDYSIVLKSNRPCDDDALPLMKIPRSDVDNDDVYVRRKKIQSVPDGVGAVADRGMVITYDPHAGYVHRGTSLHDAAKQVLEGTYGLIVDMATHQAVSKVTDAKEVCYVPIIVTTANLFACEYDPNALDRERFDASDIDLENVNAVMYHFPHPSRARFPDQIVAMRSTEQASLATRWPVAIATVEGLRNLLKGLGLFCGAGDAP